MYAVIKTGGKQFKVSEGLTLKVEKLTTEVGKQLSINHVLTLVDGEKVTIGTPLVKGATVDVTVLAHGRGDKIKIFKIVENTTESLRVIDKVSLRLKSTRLQ